MPIDKAAILIKRTALAVEKLSNHILAPYELTNTQYRVLMLLYRSPGQPVRQADIEAKFSLTNPTVTGIIQNLEKKDMIRRIPNPSDRRSKLITLTDKARAMESELCALGESLEAQVTDNLTEEECRQLMELLRKVLPGT